MYDAVELIKTAALEAYEAAKPVSVVFGRVISEEPFKIQTEQKAVYTERMIIFTNRLKKESFASGDTAVFIRLQGGKRLLALDILSRNENQRRTALDT